MNEFELKTDAARVLELKMYVVMWQVVKNELILELTVVLWSVPRTAVFAVDSPDETVVPNVVAADCDDVSRQHLPLGPGNS